MQDRATSEVSRSTRISFEVVSVELDEETLGALTEAAEQAAEGACAIIVASDQ